MWILIKILFLIILIIISAFFSGSEVALFSLNKKKLKTTFSGNPLILRYVTRLLDSPRRLLVTVLIGNNLAHVAASIIAVTIAINFARQYNISENIALTIQIILLTILIIIFGEISPKVWAQKNPVSFSKFIVVPFYWCSVIIYPASEILTEMVRSLVSTFGNSGRREKLLRKKSAITHNEISHLADLGYEKGALGDSEQEMIQSIVSAKDITVKEIMRPRVDIQAISKNNSFEELINLITTKGYSRIPLYENDLDNITGVIHAKDLLPFIKNEVLRKQFVMTKIAREVLFVPETKLISDMMKEFQQKKMHIAIVVDEYGGTSGLVTLEDIVEEIIGEIRDEFDKEETSFIKSGEGTYLLSGSLSIDEVNEKLGVNINTERGDYETLAGFVFSHAEEIPKNGYQFVFENYKFTIKEIDNKRIKKILVEKIK